MDNLPVAYRSNSKAWITFDLFAEWLKTVDTIMGVRKKKILLLIDSAPCHGKEPLSLENITIHFLPPNTTSHL
jgi:DDE superfamily endonuclease